MRKGGPAAHGRPVSAIRPMMSADVLLVEDDDSIGDVLAVHLGAEGYRLHRETNGLDAIRVLGLRPWDIVLLDLMLPGASGFDVCRQLRAHHAATPVIMLSARGAEEQRVAGLELGADDYLAKPFSMRELIARMKALTRRIDASRRQGAAAQPLLFAGFRLCPVSRVLTGPDGDIALTMREFDLLAFLAGNAGKAFSCEQLLHWVWGDGFDGYEHTVNSHINRLRAKIETDPREPRHILTLWGCRLSFCGGSMRLFGSLAARLSVAVVLLLLGFGLLVAFVSRTALATQEDEALQRLSHGLAAHIVGNWPDITLPDPDAGQRRAPAELLAMLSSVNPGIQVYVLDADGRVDAYIGEPGMVRQFEVDLVPVRGFLSGAALPLRGTDPMGSGQRRPFSAAMFPPRTGDSRPPGYLYIVLDGASRQSIAREVGDVRFRSALQDGIAVALLASIVVALLLVQRLSLPLRRLARQIAAYRQEQPGIDAGSNSGRNSGPNSGPGDEVAAIERAFRAMTLRIEDQAATAAAADAAHRETLAGVAHDLRTPLTALHGQLEAMAGPAFHDADLRSRLITAALGQSDRVRRLSQQLFELAALDASTELRRPERFLLDELVTDAVQKLEGSGQPARVQLSGTPPGPVAIDGDLELIERALTNLIENALHHGGDTPVLVSLSQHGTTAEIVVEDGGPGLPADLGRRLEQGGSVRDPALRRPSGGIGGLGLAIAQRIAILHGGALRPLPASGGGAKLCLALPLAA